MPIFVSLHSSSPSPSSSSDNKNVVMLRAIQVYCTQRMRTGSLSLPSDSPDERVNNSTLGAVARIPHSRGHMTTTIVALTPEQICANVMEDVHDYQDEWIDELTDQLGTAYSCTFMHVAMIAHWATLFCELVLMMLTNFSSTPSIAIPAVCNLDPPPIFPTASGSGPATAKLELEYPPSEDNDWEVQSVDTMPALPIPPPQHAIHLEVIEHLHTLHVAIPTPPMHDLGPNCEPITPTNPVPSMPSSPLQFLQVDPLDTAPSFTNIVNALVQYDIDTQVERIVQEDEEEAHTPLPTGPQPGVHPGPRWHVNFEEAAIHYIFHIPTDSPNRYKIAPFIMIDWNTTSPELLGM